ncbi:GNAT family N-acetyltransferase [Embleya sp. NPDC020886]|uniref:GNAT family N-acetyltransferase n=1 Tax=Embleya sp. NPDC020886 TaxID=3363980 RepID=UPI00379BFA54
MEQANEPNAPSGADLPGPGALQLRRGLPPDARRRAAELYWEAFGRKLGAALGPPEAGIAFLATHLNADRAIAAIRDGVLVGVAGYTHAGRSFTGGSALDVLRAYGRIGGLHRVAILALLERRPKERELVMDGIAVDPNHRGQGIGSRLLEEIATLAPELGCRRIRLDVIDVNPRARALYERHDFTAIKTEHTPYLRGLLGFGAATTMTRNCQPTAQNPGPNPSDA